MPQFDNVQIYTLHDKHAWIPSMRAQFDTMTPEEEITEIFGSVESNSDGNDINFCIYNDADWGTVLVHNGLPFRQIDAERFDYMASHKIGKKNVLGASVQACALRAILAKYARVDYNKNKLDYTLNDLSIVISKVKEDIPIKNCIVKKNQVWGCMIWGNFCFEQVNISKNYPQLSELYYKYMAKIETQNNEGVLFIIPTRYDLKDKKSKQQLRKFANRYDNSKFFINEKNIFENKPGYYLDPLYNYPYLELELFIYSFNNSKVGQYRVLNSTCAGISCGEVLYLNMTAAKTITDGKKPQDIYEEGGSDYWIMPNTNTIEKKIQQQDPVSHKINIRLQGFKSGLDGDRTKYYGTYQDGIYPYIGDVSLRITAPAKAPNGRIRKYFRGLASDRPGTMTGKGDIKKSMRWKDTDNGNTSNYVVEGGQLFMAEVCEPRGIDQKNSFFSTPAAKPESQLKNQTRKKKYKPTTYMTIFPFHLMFLIRKYVWKKNKLLDENNIILKKKKTARQKSLEIKNKKLKNNLVSVNTTLTKTNLKLTRQKKKNKLQNEAILVVKAELQEEKQKNHPRKNFYSLVNDQKNTDHLYRIYCMS